MVGNKAHILDAFSRALSFHHLLCNDCISIIAIIHFFSTQQAQMLLAVNSSNGGLDL